MSAITITPIKTAGMVAPVLRPLPVMFAYARLTAESQGRTASLLDNEFNANLRALAAIVDKLGRSSGGSDAACRKVIDRCVAISGLTGVDLATGLDGLCADLTAWHQESGKTLRQAVAADQEGYRDLYRKTVPAKNILLLHVDEPLDQIESLERKLRDRCYYDCESVPGDWTNARFDGSDFVLFAPTQRPIEANIMATIERHKLPFLILMGQDRSQDQQNMALLKSEFLYRKSGYQVLRNPFNPPRLYYAIDSIGIKHLATTVLAIPTIKTAAAALPRAAEGGR
jgi:hypothetical protein